MLLLLLQGWKSHIDSNELFRACIVTGAEYNVNGIICHGNTQSNLSKLQSLKLNPSGKCLSKCIPCLRDLQQFERHIGFFQISE